ncbi:MAG TPA: hypothetical protein VLM75_11735 [Spirochaetota bacterium]|nr:hypothetical protein [Spirochaetota bacterium]
MKIRQCEGTDGRPVGESISRPVSVPAAAFMKVIVPAVSVEMIASSRLARSAESRLCR